MNTTKTLQEGPLWQLRANAEHYRASAVEAGRIAEQKLREAEKFRALEQSFLDAIKKLTEDVAS